MIRADLDAINSGNVSNSADGRKIDRQIPVFIIAMMYSGGSPLLARSRGYPPEYILVALLHTQLRVDGVKESYSSGIDPYAGFHLVAKHHRFFAALLFIGGPCRQPFAIGIAISGKVHPIGRHRIGELAVEIGPCRVSDQVVIRMGPPTRTARSAFMIVASRLDLQFSGSSQCGPEVSNILTCGPLPIKALGGHPR